MFCILLAGIGDLADLVIDKSNEPRNCRKAVWYMMFTYDISTIRKYRMLPRVATKKENYNKITKRGIYSFGKPSYTSKNESVRIPLIVLFSQNREHYFETKAPSKGILILLKTHLFISVLGLRPHGDGFSVDENERFRKLSQQRIFLKMLFSCCRVDG